MAEDESAKAGKDSAKKKESVEKPVQPHYAGHRERLREKFRRSGAEALHEYELLELMLFRSVPRRDVKPLAKALIKQFGSLSETLGASPGRLMETEGINQASAVDLALIRSAAMEVSGYRAKRTKTVLASSSEALDYCRDKIARRERKSFLILFLNKKNGILCEEIHQVETMDCEALHPVEIMKRAVDNSASAIILAQNRPSGELKPSREEINMTRQIEKIASGLTIMVHDHFVIGEKIHVSFRGDNLF